MTQENLKKLLKHLQAKNKVDAVKDILSKYPHLKEQPVAEETKSKVKK